MLKIVPPDAELTLDLIDARQRRRCSIAGRITRIWWCRLAWAATDGVGELDASVESCRTV